LHTSTRWPWITLFQQNWSSKWARSWSSKLRYQYDWLVAQSPGSIQFPELLSVPIAKEGWSNRPNPKQVKLQKGTLFHTSGSCKVVSPKHTGDIAPKWRPTPNLYLFPPRALGKRERCRRSVDISQVCWKTCHIKGTSEYKHELSQQFHIVYIYTHIWCIKFNIYL
jgi:hypothetical protein